MLRIDPTEDRTVRTTTVCGTRATVGRVRATGGTIIRSVTAAVATTTTAIGSGHMALVRTVTSGVLVLIGPYTT